MLERVNELNRAVTRQSNRLTTVVGKTEFVCRGGELRLGSEIMARHRTIPGVGPLMSATWLAQVGDATRFQNARQAQSFCGFDPSIMVSAGKVTAHTRKKGHVFLHYMIKQVAQNVINKANEPLGVWGRALSKRHRKGGYNKAVGAVGPNRRRGPPRTRSHAWRHCRRRARIR
ncbi:MAG: transposase [Pirellulales bacterium]